MKRFPFPLQYSIPATLLIFGSLLGLYSFNREIDSANLRNEKKAVDYTRFIGDRTSGLLSYLYQRADGEGTDLVFSQLQDETYLRAAFLLDGNNRVLLSTQRRFRNLLLDNTSIAEERFKIEAVRQSRAGRVSLSSNHTVVQAIYPVLLPSDGGEVLSSRVGVLFLEYDQLGSLKYQAFKDGLRRSLEFSLVLFLFCVAVWYFFEKTLTLRAGRLVAASNRLAEGDLSIRAELSGTDELAQISNAFDQMAGVLQTKTEALQSAQATLAQAHADVSRQAEQLSQTLVELQAAQTQLIHTEKMSSLGQLVAGVAHEINNPINFIYGNIPPTSEYVQNLLALVELYQEEFVEPSPAVQRMISDIDLAFIAEDLPKTLASLQTGAERICQIVLNLRNFSRLDEAEMKVVDVHEGIDSTLAILQHRLKFASGSTEIKIVKDYGNLPEVECYAGQLNQVFMNILSNAIDALEESIEHHNLGDDKQELTIWNQEPTIAVPDFELESQDTSLPTGLLKDGSVKRIHENIFAPSILIRTRVKSVDWIAVHIMDNGPGISRDIQHRLFEPFFTTKPVGKGTGLGMSISYQIVVEKHGGVLSCISIEQQGAEFVIEIPVCQNT